MERYYYESKGPDIKKKSKIKSDDGRTDQVSRERKREMREEK